jgi:DNA-binding NarL/FixJ family response regulator
MLIADDSEQMLRILAQALVQIAGIEIVGQTRDAPETIAAIRELQPEVVILDVRMPGGGGIAVLKDIQPMEPRPLVIMLSFDPNHNYRQTCLELGAAHFFDKTTEFTQLIELCRRLASQKRQ